MTTVAILGCGPAGLFAAQACNLAGIEPVIISKRVPSNIYGAQYLHQKIPGLSLPSDYIPLQTMRHGTSDGYAERVYGDASRVTSWDSVLTYSTGWDLRIAYSRSWLEYSYLIVDQVVDPSMVEEMSATFDLVISTIPAWALCVNPEHKFPSRAIMVKPEVEFQIGDAPDNYVIYNGTPEGLWYRVSKIGDFASTEAVAHPSLVGQGWDLGFKVLDTDCDCHPNVVKVGRMGKWKSGVLTHHAFLDTVDAISDRFGRSVLS